MQIIWHQLTSIDVNAEMISPKLGTGNYAENIQPPLELRAKPGYYISDLRADTSYHTSGDTFVHKIYVKQEKLNRIQKSKMANIASSTASSMKKQGASDREIHDTVLIAAAFCMYNCYVDGLATIAPEALSLYKLVACQIVESGHPQDF